MNVLRVLFAAMMTVCASAWAAEYNLKFAHAVPVEQSQHLAAVKFAALVKERTKGEVNITVYPGSSLGTDQQMINLTRGGSIDIVSSGSGNFIGLVAQTGLLELPFTFRDSKHVYKVLDGKVGQGLLDEFGKHGLKGLGYLENGWRVLTNNRRPVRVPEDVKGLKIRTTPNPYHIQAFQLLGANPAPLAISELYSALETKAFDAQEHPLPVLWGAKFYEVQKFLTLTNHAYSPIIVVMNKAKFDSMPPNYQKIFVDAAREAAQYQRDLNAQAETKTIEGLKKAGMQVIEQVDMAPFRAIVYEPVRKAFVEKNGPELLNAVEAEK
jgi:tripartite ATP-independent transporter DctP family solute receptor